MGGLIRVLFPVIGYFCVATVITLTAGYGYLRSNGTLDDENMFQIVSLLHGVDLDKIAAENQTDQQDVPPEEMSFNDRRQHMLMAVLHLQAKKDDIEKNIAVFQAELNTLDNKFRHFEKFRNDVEEFLQVRKDEATASGLAAVKEHWEKNLVAKKQTKQLLVQMIKDGQMDVVIKLLNALNAKKRTEILKTFETEEDLDMLYRIEQQMLAGGPEATFIDNKLQELNQGQN